MSGPAGWSGRPFRQVANRVCGHRNGSRSGHIGCAQTPSLRLWRPGGAARRATVMTKEKLHPVHPGEVLLEEFMRPLGLSQRRVAEDVRVPVSRIRRIVRGKCRISADTAMLLARYFGTSAVVWLRLQVRCDLEVAEARLARRINREVKTRRQMLGHESQYGRATQRSEL